MIYSMCSKLSLSSFSVGAEVGYVLSHESSGKFDLLVSIYLHVIGW